MSNGDSRPEPMWAEAWDKRTAELAYVSTTETTVSVTHSGRTDDQAAASGWRIRATVLVAALLAGCGQPDGGIGPGLDRVPFSPPDSYLAMWDVAQECSGVERDVGFVSWVVAPGVWAFDTADSVGAIAYTDQLTVTIAGGWLDHPMVVRHEMLHVLLETRAHPFVPFDNPCEATEASWDDDEDFLALPPDLAGFHPDSFPYAD